MMKLLLCTVGLLLVCGVPLSQSSKFRLSKVEQGPGWHQIKEPELQKKGFTQWKATPVGFVMKNADYQVACQGHIKYMHVSCSPPMPQKAASFLEKMAVMHKSQYTPLSSPVLKPLNPTLQYEHEEDYGMTGNSEKTWGHKYDIDDVVNEGEQDNSDLDPETPSAHEMRTQQRFFDNIDVGPGNAVDEENKRDTEHDQVIKNKNVRASHKVIHGRDGLVDVPYVDAGVERVVNEHMFQFFKKHPQYHTPKAHWLTADRWRQWMLMSGDESNSIGLYGENSGDEHLANKVGGAAPMPPVTGAGPGGFGPGPMNSIWKGCPEKIHEDWPDTPEIQCKQFAISPVGFWGCDSLFEDGTCINSRFYKDIRWDGLDAYPLPKKSGEEAQQYKNPNSYQDEILPGGNPE